jgi:hypothetical protein
MVSGVQSSTSSTAYLKSSQLGSGSSVAQFKKEIQVGSEDSNVANSSAPKKTEASAKENLVPSSEKTDSTQLQARNDQETLQSEQTRGSLLDIAV